MDFKKQTYSNQVAHHIRETIRNGFLVQGDPVKEVLLAETLGISRAPVREALQTLIQEGLITSEPQKGKQVRKLTAKEIHDSYIVGGILEGAGVADSLSEWTAADMKKLTELLNIMERQSRHATSLDELVDIDEAFHGTLLMHCDNTQLGGNGPFLLRDHFQIPLLPLLDLHVHAAGILPPAQRHCGSRVFSGRDACGTDIAGALQGIRSTHGSIRLLDSHATMDLSFHETSC